MGIGHRVEMLPVVYNVLFVVHESTCGTATPQHVRDW